MHLRGVWGIATAAVLGVVLSAGRGAGDEPKPPPKEKPRVVLQRGHSSTSSVIAVAFAPDGKRVLTGSHDGTACLWDVETGKEMAEFTVGTPVESLAFAADGERILTVGNGNVVFQLWDARNGKLLLGPAGAGGGMGQSVSFAPNGESVLTGSFDGIARLWDASTGRERRRLRHSGLVKPCGFAREGKCVLTLVNGANGVGLFLWDAEAGKVLGRFGGPQLSEVTVATLSPDGTQLLTVGGGRSIVVWDVGTGRALRRFAIGEHAYAHVVAFSPDGNRVLAGGYDLVPARRTPAGVEHRQEELARVWDAATGKELLVARGHSSNASNAVKAVAFSADGRWFLTGGDWAVARLWDAQTGRELRRFEGRFHWPNTVAFSPDGRQVLTSEEWPQQLAVSPDGKVLSGGFMPPVPRLWEVATGRELRRFRGHTLPLDGLAFAPDGTRMVTTSTDNTLRLWDVLTGQELRRLNLGQSLMAMHLVFAPDSRRVFVGCLASAFLWDSEAGRVVCRFQSDYSAEAVAFSPDGKRVAFTRDADPTARLWDTESGRELRTFPAGDPIAPGGAGGGGAFPQASAGVTAVAFSPDGKRLLTGGFRSVRLWDEETGRELRRFEGEPPTVTFVAFLPGGKRVVADRWGGAAQIWDVETGKEVHAFPGPGGRTPSKPATCLMDGGHLLVGSRDTPMRLWDLATNRETASMLISTEGILVITPDGHYQGSRGALEGVALRVGNRALPFEQFDLKLNRPDLVLQSTGLGDPELIDAYRRAHAERLRRMNFTQEMLGDDFEVPEVSLDSDTQLVTRERVLKLQVRARSATHRLDRVNAYANGVPVRGLDGIALRDKQVNAWNGEIPVELASGENVIEVTALNDAGAESVAAVRNVACEASAPKPNLYVVAVGVSDYQDARYRLTYADKDARELAAFFQSKTDRFGKAAIRPILNREATREQVLGMKELLRQSTVDDLVVVFFAGHGLLDEKLDYYFGTSDIDFRDPSRRGLRYADIESLLDGIPARRKLLLMDTCHSGEVDRTGAAERPSVSLKVGESKPRSARGLEPLESPAFDTRTSAQLLGELFADLRRGTGTVVIAAAGGAEYALESADVKNGVFTHAVLQGLKGQDGTPPRVSVLRDYVFEEVRRLTRDRQSPTARRENLAYDFPLY